MATPASPVIAGLEDLESVIGADQPEYTPLPAIRCGNGDVLTKWKLSDEEKARVAGTGEVFLLVKTFHDPLQPVLISGLPLNVEIEPSSQPT